MQETLSMTCEQLVTALEEVMGPNLKSVVLYGSAAAGDFVPGLSGHDILIIAERLGATELTAMSAELLEWDRAGNPLPQLFTAQELSAGADVFPIELLDMQQSRRVLFGLDPLADLKIDMQHYRGQLERELKVRLQLLRRSYVACAGDQERVAQLMIISVSSFLVLMRAILRLYNESSPAEKADALGPLAEHVTYDPQPFRRVLDLRTHKNGPAPGETEELFGQYLHSIEQVVHSVDQYLHPPSEEQKPLARESL
jgi:hypothetical protein